MAISSPISVTDEPWQANLRTLPRTALFVAATIVMGEQVDPVRVRNMSPHGALIEGAVLPAAGHRVELVRGHLRVSATAQWTAGNQCGLVFVESVDVSEWMARMTATHQQRVDAMVHQARKDMAAGIPVSALDSSHPSPTEREKIAAAIALLEAMEDVLADDADLVTRHADQLQSLDRVLQLLRGLVAKG